MASRIGEREKWLVARLELLHQPTDSARPWFARRQVQWSQPISSRTGLHELRGDGFSRAGPLIDYGRADGAIMSSAAEIASTSSAWSLLRS